MEYNDNGCIYLGNWLYIGLIRLWCYWRNAFKRVYWRKRGVPQYGCGRFSGKGMQILEWEKALNDGKDRTMDEWMKLDPSVLVIIGKDSGCT